MRQRLRVSNRWALAVRPVTWSVQHSDYIVRGSRGKHHSRVTGEQMKINLVGPPGAGKGTQAARLSRILELPHVAAGDLLRAVRAQDTPLGLTARQYMDAGQLVPDDLTIQIIEQRLAQPDAKDGVILDGFPRTGSQARALDASFARHNDRSTEACIVLYLKASREVVLER